jgi:hypothetical protein
MAHSEQHRRRLEGSAAGKALAKFGFTLEHVGGGILVWTREFDGWTATVGLALDPAYMPEKLRGERVYLMLWPLVDRGWGTELGDEAILFNFPSVVALAKALDPKAPSDRAAAAAWRQASEGGGETDRAKVLAKIAASGVQFDVAVAAARGEQVALYDEYPDASVLMVRGDGLNLTAKRWMRLGPERWVRVLLKPRANPRRRRRAKKPAKKASRRCACRR